MALRETLTGVISAALAEVRRRGIAIYTIALYHDHDSHAVSVCVDTEENSREFVRGQNAYNMTHFHEAIAKGDLNDAARWQANVGRNLSLGDFAVVNLSRSSLVNVTPNQEFYLEMLRALVSAEPEILRQSSDADRVLFACSSAEDEVGLVWMRCGGMDVQHSR